MPEVLGKRSLDIPMHREKEICGKRIKDKRNEEEDETGGGKEES